MPNVQMPKNLPAENLYLFCDLIAYADDSSSPIDYTGSQTYSVGFMAEGLGFGITNIDIDISATLQPIIEITFKDLYGNMAIEFQRNKEFIATVDNNNHNIDEFNYATIFDLPYPKFRLTLKGHLGHPATLELNVKRINVSFVPNDGSYEIKAEFVPNLYGFFADMPFYFLKAIKFLRMEGLQNNPQKLKEFNENYVSIFDIIEVGLLLQQKTKQLNDSVGRIESFLNAINNRTNGMFEYDYWFNGVPASDNVGKIIDDFSPMYFLVDSKYIVGNDTVDLNDPKTQNLHRNALSNPKTTTNNFAIGNALMAYCTTTKPTNKDKRNKMIGANIPQSKIDAGKALIERNLEALKVFKNKQLVESTDYKINQVTIKTIFNLLIKDSAFLVGRIIEAGKKGYEANKSNRLNDKKAIGKYFPLREDDKAHQVPYEDNSEEVRFVQKFIKALSEGIVEEKRRNVQSQSIPETTNPLKKRITNLEILSNNPYSNNNAVQFISNVLARTGIASHLVDFTGDNLDKLVDAEYENCEDAIKRLNNSTNKKEILQFCKLINIILDNEGNVKNNAKQTLSLSNNISGILNTNITIDNENRSIAERLNSYISYLNIDTQTYEATHLLNNDLLYIAPKTIQKQWLLFRKESNPNDSAIAQNTNAPIPEPLIGDWSWEVTLVDKDGIEDGDFGSVDVNDDIDNRLVFDASFFKYSEIKKKYNTIGEVKFSDAAFTNRLDSNTAAGLYYRALYSSNKSEKGIIWGLFTDERDGNGKRQRIFLSKLCKKINSGISQDDIDKAKVSNESIEKLKESDKLIYIQFHHICNTWKNLFDLNNSTNISEAIEKRYTDEFGDAKVIYEIPLQQVQDGQNLNLANAIVNIRPLIETNSQTTVLNIMANICNINNFAFMSLPGNGLRDENLSELFTPYTRTVLTDKITSVFYVLWIPTPENRAKYNDGTPLYVPFKTNLKKDVFEINFGSIDNTIVKNINMTTEDNKVTSESAIAINNISSPANSNKFNSFDCSSLSVMEGRSYKIKIEMIGNMQIIPTQFFVVNATSMFTGLYYVMKVTHRIEKDNNMSTSLEAIKMKFSGGDGKYLYIPPVTLESLNQGLNNVNQSNNFVSISAKNPPIDDSIPLVEYKLVTTPIYNGDRLVYYNEMPDKYTVSNKDEFSKKIIQIANQLSTNPNFIMATMYAESSLDHINQNKTHPVGGYPATGLIQFTQDTAIGLGTNVNALMQMSNIQQLDVVYRYFYDLKKRMNIKYDSYYDVYIAVFFPIAANKPDDYVFETKKISRSRIAQQNKIIDINKDNKITTAEFKQYLSLGVVNNDYRKKLFT